MSRPVQLTDRFLVGLDAWTSENGYALKYTDDYLKKNLKDEAPDLTREGAINDRPGIFRQHLPQNLIENKKYSREELKNKMA